MSRKKNSGEDGFALIATVVIVLFLVASAAALILPPVLNSISATNASASASELQTLHRGIVGDQVTTFGYYGDVGAYPASLMDLVRDPTGSTAGWKGPYIDVPAGSVVGGQLVDAFGNPFEYYLVNNNQNNPDRIAIISRGPDGRSSESLSGTPPANPNTAATFAGMVPTNNTYLSQTGNADNAVFPLLDSANNDSLLQRHVIGTFQPNFLHKDYSSFIIGYVPACAGLFTTTLTPATRPSEVRTEYQGGVNAFDLPQGVWNVAITSALAETPVYEGTVTIVPNATTPLAINYAPGINSKATAISNLDIHNITGVSLACRLSDGGSLGSVGNTSTKTFFPPGCMPLTITNGSTVWAALTMPYKVVGPVAGTVYKRHVGAAAINVTIRNDATAIEVRVYVNGVALANGLQVAQVAQKRSTSFSMFTGDYLTVTNNSGTLLGGSPIQITGATTLTF